jgi:hypothetical protein
MHQSVFDAFVRFSAPLEGLTHNPYLDVKGLLTVGLGCLIDPPESAANLPWVFADGSPAPAAEVLAQLRALKAQQGLKTYRSDSPSVLRATTIRLTDSGVLDVASKRTLANEAFYVKAFPSYPTWPADAQLFAHSMGWAIGAGWPSIFGNCSRLLKSDPPQFLLAATGRPDARPDEASAPCDISTHNNAGIVPRNAQNRLLLSNAQLVIDRRLPRDVLYWPSTPLLADDPTAGVA